MLFNILLLVLLINTGLGENDYPDLKDIVLELKAHKEQMAMRMAVMNESMNNLMAENTVMANSLAKVISENKELKEHVSLLTLSVNNLTLGQHGQAEKHAGNFISFTALASVAKSYEDGETVIFDEEVVDYGDSFSPDSSIFTCPVSAYYLFHASLLSGLDHDFGSGIYLDDNFIIGAFSDGRGNTYATGSMLIVTRCEKGSSVSVRARRAGVHVTYGGNKETMFTGTLLGLV